MYYLDASSSHHIPSFLPSFSVIGRRCCQEKEVKEKGIVGARWCQGGRESSGRSHDGEGGESTRRRMALKVLGGKIISKMMVMTGKKGWNTQIVPQFSDTSAHSLPFVLCFE